MRPEVQETLVVYLNFAAAIASLVGFPLAIWSILLTKRAAERSANEAEAAKDASLQARAAAERTRADLKRVASFSSLERAVVAMDDIKSLIRNAVYATVPEKISFLIQHLNEIRGPNAPLTDGELVAIQESVVTLRKIEAAIDAATTAEPKGHSSFNSLISAQIDALHPIVGRLRERIGDNQ